MPGIRYIAMLIASNVFVNIMSTWKLIQRRCYDLLSYKYSLLVMLVAFTCIFIGIIHFGEVNNCLYDNYRVLYVCIFDVCIDRVTKIDILKRKKIYARERK